MISTIHMLNPRYITKGLKKPCHYIQPIMSTSTVPHLVAISTGHLELINAEHAFSIGLLNDESKISAASFHIDSRTHEVTAALKSICSRVIN